MAGVKRLLVVALVACVVATTGHAPVRADDAAVMMAYGFAKGYTQNYQVKFNQEVDFGGFAMSQIVDMDVTESCTGKEDSLYLMTLTFNKVESGRMQGDNMVDDPMGANLTGHSITFKVDATGDTSDMRADGYIEGWPQMSKVIQNLIDNWYAYLPNKTLKIGEEWAEPNEPKKEGGLNIVSTASYKIKEKKKEKDCECAKVEGETKNDITGTQETSMGTMNVTGTGKGSVEFYFCMKNSSIVKYKAKVDMKMEMTPDGGGDTNESSIGFSMEREVK